MERHICDDCLYCEQDEGLKPCNSCIQWVDGYLTATNYTNKFLKNKGE